MVEQHELNTLPAGIRAFPEAVDIFSPDQPWLAKHLLPLLSIDLGVLRPELTGTVVHMLNPIEPEVGCIGECTSAYHTEWVRENWLAFRLTEDNRYQFLADEGYFLRADVHQADWEDSALKDAAEICSSYAAAKAHWQQHGVLATPMYDGSLHQRDYLDTLGGSLWGGNWASSHDVPSTCALAYDDKEDIYTITHQGRPFFMVGEVAGYNWCSAGADAIILLYEPVSRIALFTFDWS